MKGFSLSVLLGTAGDLLDDHVSLGLYPRILTYWIGLILRVTCKTGNLFGLFLLGLRFLEFRSPGVQRCGYVSQLGMDQVLSMPIRSSAARVA